MRGRHGRPVVVGFDNTAESQRALRWAVAEARLRQRPLHIVSVYRVTDPATMGPPGAPALPSPTPKLRGAHEHALEYARGRLDVDDVTGDLTSGSPIAELRRAAESAELLVVGARARSTRHAVSSSLAAHAPCPVVVLRERQSEPTSTIVVGLDGSEQSDNALAFAFEEAKLRNGSVEAVHYWNPISPDAGYKEWVKAIGLDQRQLVSDTVSPLRAKYPTVPVTELVLEGRPAEGLAERSETADLVAVGSRGHGRLTGKLLGSVSQGLLSHAHGPVVVVKHEL